MSGKLTRYINSITPGASERIQEKLDAIQKDRKHDERVGWVEVANLLKSLPVHELVKVIKGQSLGFEFSQDELIEIRRALGKNVSNIDRMIASEKVTEKDREVAIQWKQHNESAQDKVQQYIAAPKEGADKHE